MKTLHFSSFTIIYCFSLKYRQRWRIWSLWENFLLPFPADLQDHVSAENIKERKKLSQLISNNALSFLLRSPWQKSAPFCWLCICKTRPINLNKSHQMLEERYFLKITTQLFPRHGFTHHLGHPWFCTQPNRFKFVKVTNGVAFQKPVCWNFFICGIVTIQISSKYMVYCQLL